jgi:hypothetical protein
MDLLCDAPTTVVLTPDTTSEQAFLPEPSSLRDSLLLADRGYIDLHYLHRGQDAGGFFLLRAKAGMNPHVVEAFREDGKRLRSLRNKPLKAIHAKLPKRQRVELVVQWQVDGHPVCLRLIVSWNRRTKEFCSLVTNLPAQRYPLDMICRAYKWRWQVEIYQSCNLRRTLFWPKCDSLSLHTAQRAVCGGEARRHMPLGWPPMIGKTICLTEIPA